MKKYIFIGIFYLFSALHAEQFIYPVADFDDGKQLMVLYQKSLQCVELWMWNSTTQRAIKGLSSFVTPANLRMMPSGKGFSFIDQGYIKIKEFIKRSPRTLPIYEPIGLFSSMNWIDDETFYFVAREGDFFQIFQGDLQAQICRLTHEPADALYPQKIGSTLFYMKRTMHNEVTIIAQPWNPTPINQLLDYDDAIADQQMIMEHASSQLCYLRMISQQEGFYLQAPTKRHTTNNDCFEFSCYHLAQTSDNQWTTKQLFTFLIPSHYLIGSTRLYESLEPFLPKYSCKDSVYFMSWQHATHEFELMRYDMVTQKVTPVVDELMRYKNFGQQIFAPYFHNGVMHCGYIMQDVKNYNLENFDDQPLQKVFEMDDVQFALPMFTVNNQN